ncbi:transporter [Caulobacter sp. CCUG 60055]|uniref:ATP-grasp domain-containing protein n=1 Tax=Caulobacter sp. CCUG 60055 TaxID=2100090 RepID=UPI001FA800B8|nr:transporter [Caulobacter sp. CCUG 60055]MBQ1543283.1 transporter [Caulobacteraceae bacterium]MCI3179819.1 transporter [Caulobacter sp. CCUG 60055]
MRLVILTPATDNPRFAGTWPEWFERLAAPLRAEGFAVEPAPWTEASDLSGADAVLPLLAWGYHLKADLWAARLDAWERAGLRMPNPAATLRWNTAKTYLAELAGRGAPVVPTVAVERVTEEAVAEARARFATEVVVAKPQVSAGSQDTVRLKPGDPLDGAPRGPALLQPFLPAVAQEGEQSLFYFNGVLSHAVAKAATGGDFRVQPQFGGQVAAMTPSAEMLAVGQAVLAAADRPLAYARVDLIRDLDGALKLMELEAIEPDLYLQYAADGGAAFARGMRAALA